LKGAGEFHKSFVAGHTYLSPAQPHTQNLNMVSYREIFARENEKIMNRIIQILDQSQESN
jgi:argininosuccinate lyase